jgi:hypothetical protein
VSCDSGVLRYRATHALRGAFRRSFQCFAVAAWVCVLATHALAQAAPDAPVVQPDSPVVQPDAPVVQPDAPVVQPDAPATAVYEPWRTDRFYLETSVYTRHWHYDPAHDDHQDLILGEWNITENWLVGASYFKNSFGQPTEYVYGGYRFRPFEKVQPLYIKVSAGLVYGYKDPYKDKIPFNNSGIAPVIIPSVGYCINRFCGEAVIVGGASIILTLGVTIP